MKKKLSPVYDTIVFVVWKILTRCRVENFLEKLSDTIYVEMRATSDDENWDEGKEADDFDDEKVH